MTVRVASVARVARLAGLAASLSGLVVVLDACSSDAEVPADAHGDGGATAVVEPTDPSPPSPPVDAGATSACPAQDLSDPYCSALAARCEQCVSSMRACEVENLRTCKQTSAVFSASARRASATCLAPGCPAKGDEDCFVAAMAVAPTSAAQQAFAAEVCDRCNLDAGAACAERVFFRSRDGGVSPGPGARVKLVTDAVVAKIGQACLPAITDAGSACESALFFCANQVLAGVFPRSACADAGK
jgi:hypothetical protein